MLNEQKTQEEFCNPNLHFVMFCTDYDTQKCKHTCYYATKIIKMKGGKNE